MNKFEVVSYTIAANNENIRVRKTYVMNQFIG